MKRNIGIQKDKEIKKEKINGTKRNIEILKVKWTKEEINNKNDIEKKWS